MHDENSLECAKATYNGSDSWTNPNKRELKDPFVVRKSKSHLNDSWTNPNKRELKDKNVEGFL